MAESNPTTLVPIADTHLDEDHDYDYGVAEGVDPQLRVSMHETHEDRGSIWTRLTVSFLDDDNTESWPPMLGPVRVNLMRSDRGGMLGIMEQLAEKWPKWDWEHMLTTAKGLTIRALESNLPMTNLAEVTSQTLVAPYLIEPYIASAGVTVLYGDGGTGKSTLALALALEVTTGVPIISSSSPLKTGPVIYADYEDDNTQHANRVQAMARAHSLPLDRIEVFHLPMVSKIAREGKRLRRRIHDTEAVLMILDSVGMGRGGDALAAEDTIRMFRTLRSLDVPILAVDHISKQAKASRGNPDPYGSVYTRNSARMMWYVEKRAAKLGDPWDYLAFVHTKANHVRRSQDQYLKIKYLNATQETDDGAVDLIHSIRFEPTDVQGMPEADKAPDEGRIRLIDEITTWIWSESEPKTVKEVSTHFDKSADHTRTVLNRGVLEKSLIKVLKGTGNAYDVPTKDENKPDPF